MTRTAVTALGVAALGTRLGCLEGSSLSSSSESESTRRLLSAVRAFFDTVAVVELRKPYSRWLNTKDWRRYVGALDVFKECGKNDHEGHYHRVLEQNVTSSRWVVCSGSACGGCRTWWPMPAALGGRGGRHRC